MGIEIAVSFGSKEVTTKALSKCLDIGECTDVYVVFGSPSELSAGKHFFALWSNGEIDLVGVCRMLSATVGAILTTWKAEHGGVSGFMFHDGKGHIEDFEDETDSYLLTPAKSFEKFFDLALPFDDADRAFFPELLFSGEVKCHRLSFLRGAWVEKEEDEGTINLLLEDDLEVEPVLPFSL